MAAIDTAGAGGSGASAGGALTLAEALDAAFADGCRSVVPGTPSERVDG